MTTLNLTLELPDSVLDYYRRHYRLDTPRSPGNENRLSLLDEADFERYMAQTARQLLISLYESDRPR